MKKTIKKEELEEILEEHEAWQAFGEGKRAYLCDADLRDADLWSACLSEADLGSADLRGANLGISDLCYANLYKADLRGANLDGADLSEADLRFADLRGASLKNTTLIGANLKYAKLEGADLEGADLEGAILQGTDLENANLSRAKFLNACIHGVGGLNVLSVQVNTGMKNCTITYIPSLDIVTQYDFQGTFSEFKAHIESEFSEFHFILERYHRAIAFLEGEAKADEEKDGAKN